MPYANYHRHSHYSNIILADSVATNEDYCKRAVGLGHQIISSCEHGTQGNYRECASLAEKYGLKWRYVTEAYFVKNRFEKDNANCHLILAAKTEKGVSDLNFALSEANITGYYYRPRVDIEILLSLDHHDVFVTTACVGGVFKYGYDEAEKLIQMMKSHFRDGFMLEVQYHDTEKQREINEFLLRMYRKHNIPLIMGCDSHFLYPEEADLRQHRLEANHIRYENEDGWYMDYPSDEEAANRFVKQGILSKAQIQEAMDNTNIFLDFEDITLNKKKKLPTIYPHLSQEERNELYERTVWDKWEEFAWCLDLPEEERLRREKEIKYEINTITSTNTSDYFLLNHELVKRGVEKGGLITPTGRGSGASFFTNTLLGFSSVDRFEVPVEMFPDRFISADRLRSNQMPDLDMNCGRREFFEEAQKEILGEWGAAPMLAYGTLKRLSAWKMYCKSNDVPFKTANEISEFLKKYENDVKYADAGAPEDDEGEASAINVFDYVPEHYHEILRMSEKYMGMVDKIAPHACAYLLFQGDIRRETGVFRINCKGENKRTVYAAFIDGGTAEEYGYLKNDILIVSVVSVNNQAYHRAGIKLPSASELLKMVDGDKETWRMYADGLTMGLNQVEQDKTTERIMRYKPKNITELAAFIAAVRPGFKSMFDTFINRRRFVYGIPVFDSLIQTREMRDSFLVYQEQVMKVFQYSGWSGAESYQAIKAIAKKIPEKVAAMKDRFRSGFGDRLRASGVEDEDSIASAVDKVWQIIDDSSAYLFNSSHSVCVALDSLYGAYAKAHYPMEYYVTLLDLYAQKGDKDRAAKVKQEMKQGFGISVVPCKFRQDNRGYYIDKENNQVSDALTSVKFISKKVADQLYRMRNHQYAYFTDLLYDMEINAAFDSRVITILIQLGYFEEFGKTQKLLGIYDNFKNGPSRFSKSHIEKTRRNRIQELRDEEWIFEDEDIDPDERIKCEIEYCGAPVSVYPERKGDFAVLEVDEAYSPKILLYNIAMGTTGVMKIKKPAFKAYPLEKGDIITLSEWQKKPAYQFINGKPEKKAGLYDLWMTSYLIKGNKDN